MTCLAILIAGVLLVRAPAAAAEPAPLAEH